MATVVDLIGGFERLNLADETKKIFTGNTQHITTLIQGQMFEGKTGKGEVIRNQKTGGGYRSEAYAAMKHAQNPLPGNGVPDLYLTGSFYKKMVSTVKGDLIETQSADPKESDLLDKYGKDVFLVGEDSRANFNHSVFLPDFADAILKETGLKLQTN
jgi:hypothetical protein